MPNQAQVSTSLCSQGPVAQSSLQWVLLGWRTKVDPTRLRSRRRDKAHQKLLQQDRNRFRRIPPRLDDFCAHMPQDLPADNAVRHFWTSPHNRPFTSSSATISLTRDTCSEITTRPMTMTLPSRLLFFARYQVRPATQDNLSAVTVLNLLQKCVVHFCSEFNIVTGASAPPPLLSSSCSFVNRATPSSRSWPEDVLCLPEACRRSRLASRQPHPEPLPCPLRRAGPVPTTTAQAVPCRRRAFNSDVGQVFDKHLTPGGFPHLRCA